VWWRELQETTGKWGTSKLINKKKRSFNFYSTISASMLQFILFKEVGKKGGIREFL
jgi:hypothetical protein